MLCCRSLVCLAAILSIYTVRLAWATNSSYPSNSTFNGTSLPFDPNNPCVPCELLPDEFLECEAVTDTGECKFGASSRENLDYTSVVCHVLPNIECFGPYPVNACTRSTNISERTFVREFVPCIRYSGQYFLSTLLYSIFLGFCAVDRFCLGYKGSAAGKIISLGGLGVWWIVDIVLLVTNNLHPADNSAWEPHF
eukprot:gene9337-1603_t